MMRFIFRQCDLVLKVQIILEISFRAYIDFYARRFSSSITSSGCGGGLSGLEFGEEGSLQSIDRFRV